MFEQKNDTHIVIKREYLDELFKSEYFADLKDGFYMVLGGYATCRMKNGRPPVPDYYVVNKDEPYKERL